MQRCSFSVLKFNLNVHVAVSDVTRCRAIQGCALSAPFCVPDVCSFCSRTTAGRRTLTQRRVLKSQVRMLGVLCQCAQRPAEGSR